MIVRMIYGLVGALVISGLYRLNPQWAMGVIGTFIGYVFRAQVGEAE